MNNGPAHNAEGRAIHWRNMEFAQNNNLLPEEAVVNAMNPAANRALEDAFRAAVIAGNVEEINRIAEEGRIDPNAALDEQDHPALWLAVHAAQQDAIRALVENGAEVDITTNNSDGTSGPLLNEAIHMNNLPLVRLLLELGANPNIGGSERSKLPLLTAFALEGPDRRTMVEVLVAGGADPNKIIRVEDQMARADNPHRRNIPFVNSTLLNYFMHLNDREAISILMTNGANPRIAVDGVTPYNLAVVYEDAEYMRQFAPATARRRHALQAVAAAAPSRRSSRRNQRKRKNTRKLRRGRRAI